MNNMQYDDARRSSRTRGEDYQLIFSGKQSWSVKEMDTKKGMQLSGYANETITSLALKNMWDISFHA